MFSSHPLTKKTQRLFFTVDSRTHRAPIVPSSFCSWSACKRWPEYLEAESSHWAAVSQSGTAHTPPEAPLHGVHWMLLHLHALQPPLHHTGAENPPKQQPNCAAPHEGHGAQALHGCLTRAPLRFMQRQLLQPPWRRRSRRRWSRARSRARLIWQQFGAGGPGTPAASGT